MTGLVMSASYKKVSEKSFKCKKPVHSCLLDDLIFSFIIRRIRTRLRLPFLTRPTQSTTSSEVISLRAQKPSNPQCPFSQTHYLYIFSPLLHLDIVTNITAWRELLSIIGLHDHMICTYCICKKIDFVYNILKNMFGTLRHIFSCDGNTSRNKLKWTPPDTSGLKGYKWVINVFRCGDICG